MRRIPDKIYQALILAAGLILCAFAVCFSDDANTLKEESLSISSGTVDIKYNYQIQTDKFFLENSRDSYTYVEVNLPIKEGRLPVVFISHGFSGTINSGGAKELSEYLAKAGIAAIRCDWNPYIKPDLNSQRTDTYSLKDMERDYKIIMDYAINKYNIDESGIGIYGRSYGGRFAMKAANLGIGGYDIKALALIAPAGDEICFKRFLGGEDKYYKLRNETMLNGYSTYLGVKLYPNWFTEVEEYTPSKEGEGFGNKPVLLFYNTLDKVVFPDTSRACALTYKNHEIIAVTTDDGHGYEMGYKSSPLKTEIMGKLVEFFLEYL